jgi:hypothetical protein
MHTFDISHRKKHRCFFEVDIPNWYWFENNDLAGGQNSLGFERGSYTSVRRTGIHYGEQLHNYITIGIVISKSSV